MDATNTVAVQNMVFELSRVWMGSYIMIFLMNICFCMITKQENKQSRNAPYLPNYKDTKFLQFTMAVSVLPVPLHTSHTTDTVNHKIVKAMEKEDRGPTKFIAYPKEKVNLYFVILKELRHEDFADTCFKLF